MPTAQWFWPGEGLALKTAPFPTRQLAAHEVRIAVHAASLNYRDLLICKGEYPAPADRPIVPCSDGAGTVLEVGAEATHIVQVGDRVTGSFFPHWLEGPPTRDNTAETLGCNLDGWLAEEIILPAHALAKIPAGMSFIEAACAPCAGVTAWVALKELAKLVPGQTVLIQGTGGVAMWMARLAQASKVRTIIVTSDTAKVATLQLTGASVISYRDHPDWSREVLRLTQGQGADLVLEVGGRSTIAQSLQAVAFNGHVALVGGLGGWTYDQIDSLALLTKRVTVHGVYVGSKRHLVDLLAFSAERAISPHVSAVYKFADAAQAFHALESGQAIGKIVVSVNPSSDLF